MKVCVGELLVPIGQPNKIYRVKKIGYDKSGKAFARLDAYDASETIERRARMLPDGRHVSIHGFESITTGIQKPLFD